MISIVLNVGAPVTEPQRKSPREARRQAGLWCYDTGFELQFFAHFVEEFRAYLLTPFFQDRSRQVNEGLAVFLRELNKFNAIGFGGGELCIMLSAGRYIRT